MTTAGVVEQRLVATAIVNGFDDGLDGKPIFPGNFVRRQRLQTDGFAVKDFCPDSAMHEQLSVVRARFGLQVLVLNSIRHVLFLDESTLPILAQGEG